MDALLEPTCTGCNHWFCWECIGAYLRSQQDSSEPTPCPCCRGAIVRGELQRANEQQGMHTGPLQTSSKVEAVALALQELLAKEPEAKVLVFGEFRATLAALGGWLRKQEIKFETIDGTMQQSRSDKISIVSYFYWLTEMCASGVRMQLTDL